MGAWGCGTFENDDALDWLKAMVGGGCIEAVPETLGRAAEADFLDAPEACSALAAAEVVAAALDHPHPRLPERVRGFLETRRAALVALRVQALRALRNVRQNSELQELWEDFGPEGWYRELGDLESRLA